MLHQHNITPHYVSLVPGNCITIYSKIIDENDDPIIADFINYNGDATEPKVIEFPKDYGLCPIEL